MGFFNFFKPKKFELVFNDHVYDIYSIDDDELILPYGVTFIYVLKRRRHLTSDLLNNSHCYMMISDGKTKIKDLPTFSLKQDQLMPSQLYYNRTQVVDDFFRAFFKVFDTEGNIKAVGRDYCMHLITKANSLVRVSDIDFEEGKDSGCINIFGVFALAKTLSKLFYMTHYVTEEEFLLHNNIKVLLDKFKESRNFTDYITYKNTVYVRKAS